MIQEKEIKVRFFYLVWIGFIISTVVFILITTVFIKLNARRDNSDQMSTGETIYRQLEYVLTIVASQGNQSININFTRINYF